MGEKAGKALVPVQERVAELQAKKHQGMLQLGEHVGALKMSRFHARFAKYMELHSLVVALDNGAYETYGVDAKTFCKEIAGVSYETANNFRNLCKEAKAEVITAIKVLGYTNNTIELLKTSDDEEVKALMSKGTLVVGSEEIPVTPENMPKVIKHIEKVVKRNNDLEVEKEELGKKLEGKYDMADRNKKLEENNRRLEKDLKLQLDRLAYPDDGFMERIKREKITADSVFFFIDQHIDQMRKGLKKGEMYPVKAIAEFKKLVEYVTDLSGMYADVLTNLVEGDMALPPGVLTAEAKRIKEEWGLDFLKDLDDHRVPPERLREFEAKRIQKQKSEIRNSESETQNPEEAGDEESQS